mgnify:CR=1 FL=1
MKVKYFIGGYDKNICYLLWCQESRYAAIIDPSVEINPILEYISQKKLILDKILITHSHHDHIKYVSDYLDYFNLIKVYLSHKSAKKFKFISLTNNQIISIGYYMITCMETPGHYYDSMCFWDSKNKRIFTGDTIFIGRTGRVISSMSSIEDLYRSVYNILLKLPLDTVIHPGHDYGYSVLDTIENNIASSSFFNCQNLEEFRVIMQNYEKNRKK